MKPRTFARTCLSAALALHLLSLGPLAPVWTQPPASGDAAARAQQLESRLEETRSDLARTEKHLRNYLFPAFLVVWLVLFAYLRYLDRRQRALEHALDDLRAALPLRTHE